MGPGVLGGSLQVALGGRQVPNSTSLEAQLCGRPGQDAGVSELLCQGIRFLHDAGSLRPATKMEEGLGPTQVQFCQAAVCIVQCHVLAGIRLDGCSPVQILDRLGHKGSLHQLIGGLDQVGVGLGRDLPLLEVVGQGLDDIGHPSPVEPLEGLSDTSMVDPSVRQRGLLNQDILQAILSQLKALGLSDLPLSHQACSDELIHTGQQAVLVGGSRQAQ